MTAPSPTDHDAAEAAAAVGEPGASPTVRARAHALPASALRDPALALLAAPEGPAAAALRLLRHRLGAHGPPRVLAVTAPGPGDGATTLALGLALALAESGRSRVLLLEANLGRPALARRLALPALACAAARLRRTAGDDPPWEVAALAAGSLHVAAVSPRRPPGGLLEPAAVTAALAELRDAGYDHLVLDAPAVLGSAEANLLCGASDAAVLAARAGRTTARALAAAVTQLAPAAVLGAALLG